ncbi:MAG: cytochrome c [Gammaproteobacteria bacterium]|nr:cytochrome c [Gammaproteobacteria bacterium]
MKTINVLMLSALFALSGCGDSDDVASGLDAADSMAPAAISGADLFATHCARCHNPGADGVHPGTQQLALTRGEEQAVILQRDDLQPDYVKQVVRHGIGAMATFRPTEISDPELDALARYVTDGGR